MKATEWKVGMSSCCAGVIDRALFEQYAAAGIDCMEVSYGIKERADSADFAQVGKDARATGVQLWSLHLPFAPFSAINIASPDKDIRRFTVDYLSELIKKGGDIGIPVAVIHPSGEPNPDNERADRTNYAAECLSKLAEAAACSGMTIAVEDLPRTCIGNHSDDFKVLLSADERLRVCFDTNHLLIQENADFVRAVGDKIITLHVSDYDKRNERHWLPGEGKVDWVELVTLLEEVGYTGPWMYEIGFGAPKSITRRTLTCEDFYANYKAVTAKQKPEVLGVPVQSECDANAYIK
ncbi:MAG: sugar phosphate isomerase/epimerase [Clostridia bacterium]|nr:sugar phosphate isomerase/epimerase [Clostridia bacterium]